MKELQDNTARCKQLLEAAINGDTTARGKLIEDFFGLVHVIVHKYIKNVSDQRYDDYFQSGCTGLIKGVDYLIKNGFDEHKAKFATILGRCIENDILYFIKRESKHANLQSLDVCVKDTDNLLLIETIEDKKLSNFEDKISDADLVLKIKENLHLLPPHLAKIVSLKFLGQDNISQTDIAKELNVSQSYVSRLEIKTIKLLREIHNINITPKTSNPNHFEERLTDKNYKAQSKAYLPYLPKLQRKLFSKRFLGEKVLSRKEIADELEIPVPSVYRLEKEIERKINKMIKYGVKLKDRLQNYELLDEVRNLLHILTVKEADIINLTYLGEQLLSVREIADKLKMPESTVRQLKSKALTKLAKAMKIQQVENE